MSTTDIFSILYARYQKLFLTVPEIAIELCISQKTARNWISEDCFPLPTERIKGRRLVALMSLSDYYAGLTGGVESNISQSKSESIPVAKKRGRGRPPNVVLMRVPRGAGEITDSLGWQEK